ncbi:MAG: hypothetical protein WCW87_01825 [Candidatus Paceibacterota bacterium]
MLKIVVLLHVYQPPTQVSYKTEEIYYQSYLPHLEMLESRPEFLVSIDIPLSLVDQIKTLPKGFTQRLNRLHRLNRQVEFVNTSAYHYLFPLLFPYERAGLGVSYERMIEKQLELNKKCYQEFFEAENVTGVFPPEMAFDSRLVPIFQRLGYKWCLACDDPFKKSRLDFPEHERVPQNWVPSMNDFGIILRSREWSDAISFEKYTNGYEFGHYLINSQLNWKERCQISGDTYIVIAMDGETFGHHQENAFRRFLIPFFDAVMSRKSVCEFAHLSDVYESFPRTEVVIPEGTWSTADRSNPYPLWRDPGVEFHTHWNLFMHHALRMWDPDSSTALNQLLEKSFYSCTPWLYSLGKGGVARWCLPLFKQIIDYTTDPNIKIALEFHHNEMDRLTR